MTSFQSVEYVFEVPVAFCGDAWVGDCLEPPGNPRIRPRILLPQVFVGVPWNWSLFGLEESTVRVVLPDLSSPAARTIGGCDRGSFGPTGTVGSAS